MCDIPTTLSFRLFLFLGRYKIPSQSARVTNKRLVAADHNQPNYPDQQNLTAELTTSFQAIVVNKVRVPFKEPIVT